MKTLKQFVLEDKAHDAKETYDTAMSDGSGDVDIHKSEHHHVINPTGGDDDDSIYVAKHNVGGRTEHSVTAMSRYKSTTHKKMMKAVSKMNPHLHKDTVHHISKHLAHHLVTDHNENMYGGDE